MVDYYHNKVDMIVSMMVTSAIISCLLLINTTYQDSISDLGLIENSVVGEPEVECGLDGIEIDVITTYSFFGRLYVQVSKSIAY
ncbi:unnamed protein product [Wuchereria bancrofti]|uniref:Uncharacterized protein n=1 Tax=Wuchereria bancrofti TaxID=6293 RepID=A0A3P7FQT8_WUCBA|nr:unnamed protein product [Wuchereria bancrofti]